LLPTTCLRVGGVSAGGVGTSALMAHTSRRDAFLT